MSRRLALVVGNTTYTDRRFNALSTPAQDVHRLVELLTNPRIGAFDEVDPLMNQTETVVSRAVERFFSNKSCDDLLLFYFSGHGMLDAEGHLYLALTDTEWDAPRSSAVASEFVTRAMDATRSSRVVLILDCCHSGAFARGTKAAVGASVGTKTAFEGNGYGHCVLTATDAIQYAWEGDKLILGDDLKNSGTSVFTRYLVEGVQNGEADIDQDGLVTVQELHSYIYERIKQQKLSQTPMIWTYQGKGNLVVASNPKPVIASKTSPDLPQELLDAIHNPYPDVRKGAVRTLARLAAGQHSGVALLAKNALTELSNDDSRQVAQAASDALEGRTTPTASFRPHLPWTNSRPSSFQPVAVEPVKIVKEVGPLAEANPTAGPSAETIPARGQPAGQTPAAQRRTAPVVASEWITKAEKVARSTTAAARRYCADSLQGLQTVSRRVAPELRKPAFVKASAASALALVIVGVLLLYHGQKDATSDSAHTTAQTEQAANTAVPSAPEKTESEPPTQAENTSGPSATPALETQQTAAPVRVSSDLLAPYLLHKTRPKYPAVAQTARVQGTVTLAAIIRQDGRVGEITAKKGHPMLVPPAIEAVRQWRYRPYLVDGKATEVQTEIAVRFRLTPPTPAAAAAPVPAAPGPAKPAPSGGQADPSLYPQLPSTDPHITPPRTLYAQRPEYTEQARQARLQGIVVLTAVIENDGRVGDVHVVQSLGMGLDEKAIAAVRKSKFAAATKDGKAMAVRMKITVNFVLE